ncbi:MAG: acyl carrier protein [PVC group bacterium]|nr:acyl carrier protein [PVC group bacterium]
MKEKLFNILRRVAKVSIEEVNEESSPDTIDSWDSLTHINLILAIEEEFEVNFSHDQIARMQSFKSIVECLNENL